MYEAGPNIVNIVSDRLKYYLAKKNMSIYELAKRSNKAYASTYKVVHGKNRKTVTFENLEKLANALDITITDLITPLPAKLMKEYEIIQAGKKKNLIL